MMLYCIIHMYTEEISHKLTVIPLGLPLPAPQLPNRLRLRHRGVVYSSLMSLSCQMPKEQSTLRIKGPQSSHSCDSR